MDLERILKPNEVIERLKYARKQLINGYYFILIRPDMRDRIIELLKEQETKTGHWTTKRTLQHDGEWYCNQCEYEPTVFEDTPFCPNCGAKMESRWSE